MKKLVIILFVFGLMNVSAQTVPSEEDVNAFFNTKTMVVLLDNPLLEYNMIIKEVMEQEWNITEFEFITFAQFEELRKDPQYSFLYMSHQYLADLIIRLRFLFLLKHH